MKFDDKDIEFVARIAHETNRAYCRRLGDDSHLPFDEAPDWQRNSAIAGVQAIVDHPDMGPEASHASWMEAKTADGWQWGPYKDPEKKTHPCMLPYGELPKEQRLKDTIFVAVVNGTLAAISDG